MVEILISVFIGIPIGILSSLLAWWILFHRIVPVIRFSPSISKTETDDNESGYRYRFKLENAGSRTILDVELFAKLRIRGLHPSYPNNWEVIYIPLERDRIPKIRPVKKSCIRVIFRLYIDKIDEFNKPIYPEHLRQKCKENSILLEDIMLLGIDRTLQILAFGYDEFSGARKVFESKLYNLNDIKFGLFDPKGLEVIVVNTPIHYTY